MPAVVSDTSVVNYLAAVGQTELLRVQFGEIFIPPAVWYELQAAPALPGAAAALAAQQAGWLVVQAPKASLLEARLRMDLDDGEAAAIALACELKPAIVLLDEADGRAEAERLGLSIIGTAGILGKARQSGRLRHIRPLLDRLMREHRFRLSRELYGQFTMGEPED